MTRRNSGFTLLEVLVSLGILAVVVAIVSATFTGALGVQQAADRRVEVTHAGRTVLDRIGQDLVSAFPQPAAPSAGGQSPPSESVRQPPGGLTLEDRELEGQPRDRLEFYTYARPLGGAREHASDLARVEYDLVVSDDRRDWRLIRRQTSNMQQDALAQTSGDVLAERVVAFEVAGYDDAKKEWVKEWRDSRRLPRGIRVTIRVAPEPPPGAHRPWGDGPIREALLWTYETKVALPLARPTQGPPGSGGQQTPPPQQNASPQGGSTR
jgi:prepilin-type N-terminal cleavage/methylation domain-containing protein